MVAIRLAIELELFRQLVVLTEVRHHHHVVAALARPHEGLGAHHRGDPERRVRPLGRARQRGDVPEAVELPLEGDVVFRPQPGEGLDPLLEARPALVHGDAEGIELVGHEGPRDADVEPAAADGVEHRELAGQLQRMIEDGQHRAGDHPHAPRPLAAGGEEETGVGAVAAVGREVVLDDLDAVVAQVVRDLGQLEHLLEVLAAGDPVGLGVGEVVDPELHTSRLQSATVPQDHTVRSM